MQYAMFQILPWMVILLYFVKENFIYATKYAGLGSIC